MAKRWSLWISNLLIPYSTALTGHKDYQMQKLIRIITVIITSCALIGCATKPIQSDKHAENPPQAFPMAGAKS